MGRVNSVRNAAIVLLAALFVVAAPSQAEDAGSESCGSDSGSDAKEPKESKENKSANETKAEKEAGNETEPKERSDGNETAAPDDESEPEPECAYAASAASGTGTILPTGGCQIVTTGTTTGFPYVDVQVRPECVH